MGVGMKKIIRYIIIILALCGVVFSLYKIINWKQDVDDNRETQTEINEYVQVEPENDKFDINFDELSKKNSDTVGYIFVPNTNINYVVVKNLCCSIIQIVIPFTIIFMDNSV